MVNGIITGDPSGFNKGCSSKFHVGSQVWQTPEEGRRTNRIWYYITNNGWDAVKPNQNSCNKFSAWIAWQRPSFCRSTTSLDSEFSFETGCHINVKEPSLPCYLPIAISKAGRNILGFIPFPSVLPLCEMQAASSRIWILVDEFTSYDYNCYPMYTSIL